MAILDEFKARLLELTHLKSTLDVLFWDSEVNMPAGGVTRRAETISYLRQLLHEKFLAPDFERLLLAAQNSTLDEHEQALVREVAREWGREKKLPKEFVAELASITAAGSHVWARARKANDWSVFAPTLETILALKRREAAYIGFADSPYDALLDTYEPGLLTAEVAVILKDLKKFLVPFLAKIVASSKHLDPALLKGNFPVERQRDFNERVAKRIGFDFNAGRLDISAHPFSMGLHPDDVRITTRFEATDVISALLSTLHEAGHGIYEQGLNRDHFGTPLGEAGSMGIHESQSRLWENMVGRGRPFWEFLYPHLQHTFPEPFGNISLDTFYATLNSVRPSLIRVEADEVTYNLHIILRFELEKELLEGSISVADLPEIWRQKMQTYFGLAPSSDAEGVLQDIHWSNGLIGYFPTYTLGNLYAAQLFSAAEQHLPGLPNMIKEGDFAPLREWLLTHIHTHGKRYSAMDLLQTASGEALSSQYFVDYLTKKYSAIYRLG